MARVVIYAEGAGEVLGSVTQLPPVGEPLREEMLGAAHVLVRRALADAWSVAPALIRLDTHQPTRGRQPRGSDLLDEARLRQLLTWVKPEQQPDLAIVLIDSDRDRQRATKLGRALSDLRVPKAIGMAIEEFEAWLIADGEAVTRVLSGGASVSSPSNPEALRPTEAKGILSAWLGDRAKGPEGRTLRRSIAEQCALEVLRQRCGAFERFQRELRPLKP